MQFVKATRLINFENREKIVRLGVNEHMFDVATYEKEQGKERNEKGYPTLLRRDIGVVLEEKLQNTS